jgi:hypothetical protein
VADPTRRCLMTREAAQQPARRIPDPGPAHRSRGPLKPPGAARPSERDRPLGVVSGRASRDPSSATLCWQASPPT